jgi:hypothetical protein
MNIKTTLPWVISGVMLVTGFAKVLGQNKQNLSSQNLIAYADMSKLNRIEHYDISGAAAELSERLRDTILQLGYNDIYKIQQLTPKLGKRAASNKVLGRQKYAAYCVSGWSKNIIAGFNACDVDQDFSAIKRGDASNTELVKLKNKYCGDDFEGCFLSGKLWMNDAEFNAAREKFIAEKLTDSVEIDEKRHRLAMEFEAANFTCAQIQAGAFILFKSDRNGRGSGMHATMYTDSATVSAFNGEHVRTALLPLAQKLSPRNVSGNIISGVEVINLPAITQIMLEIRGNDISNFTRNQMLEYIAVKTGHNQGIMNVARGLLDDVLRRICLDIHFKQERSVSASAGGLKTAAIMDNLQNQRF